MKSLTTYITLLIFVLVTCLTSCVREDDDPELARISISRLYVSFSEFQLNEALTPYNNIDIIDRADSATSFVPSLSYNSGIKGGSGILFNPIAKYVFQSSANGSGSIRDTTIQVMSINALTGAPASKGMISNGLLKNVKGLAYHYNNGADNLYVSNIGEGTNPSFIYLFQSPGNFRGKAIPKQRIALGTLKPWTMAFKGPEANADLLMSVTEGKKGIAIFGNILNKNPAVDSVLNEQSFPPRAVLTIADQGEIRGFSYSARQDLLAVATYVTTNGTSVGKILLYEGASALLSSSADQAISPTRIISGDLTGLKRPLDVAIDNRDGAKYLYVADADTKIVSRFLITDNGNVEPNIKKQYALTPVALSLDARGPNEQ
ncbi:hypothetical protein LZQ00_12695 [Sphingobacterium sp. SRCM116780]|uniref:hypothetical protein n=1 Tax=Sphingobacterium sp. SRCM116780 TaxID=2907623 RepID=UPI001F3CED27|nr:hypothetical protein [Sphingobacterium sp. SRCM116780]UIR55128.1 hypothetical protein LZQ00_12695 [Sphingobacterium sp. SRCM116780]